MAAARGYILCRRWLRGPVDPVPTDGLYLLFYYLCFPGDSSIK